MFLRKLSAMCVSVACVTAAVAQQWDARSDFSIERGNPNGTWSYGLMPVGFGQFTRFTTTATADGCPSWYGWGGDGTPSIWLNLSGHARNQVLPGEFAMHPGPGTEPVVLRWTAPESVLDHDVLVNGRFGSGDIGLTDGAVRLNGVTEWSASDHGSFALRLHVQSGNTIDFAVYNGYGYGNTTLEATIMMACAGDYNADQVIDLFDYLDFVNDFAAGVPKADINFDGVIDLNDYLDFVVLFAAGC